MFEGSVEFKLLRVDCMCLHFALCHCNHVASKYIRVNELIPGWRHSKVFPGIKHTFPKTNMINRVSHCVKYARIRGFSDSIFPYIRKRIRVRENLHSGIFYAVSWFFLFFIYSLFTID